MTGSGSCQPSPGAFVILANAGIHSLQLVSLDSRLRGNDGQWQSPTVAYASGSDFRVSASVFFRVIPWLILMSFSVSIKKTSLEGWARLA